MWPPLPIVISNSVRITRLLKPEDVGNVLAALRHRDRICEIDLWSVPRATLQRSLTEMTAPYPALTCLRIHSFLATNLLFPNSFLGGSSPQLEELELNCQTVACPGLEKLLSSASGLVRLHLFRLSRSGPFRPEKMVTCLSTLTRLQSLSLHFRHPPSPFQADGASQRPLTVTRIVLHALTTLAFQGDSNYLEYIVSRIDLPQLKSFHIVFFDHFVFDTPLLHYIISRTEKFKAFHQADVESGPSGMGIAITLLTPKGMADHGELRLRVQCRDSARDLSSLVQLCGSSLPPFPTLEHLHIRNDQSWAWVLPREEIPGCVELLRLFTFLKNLDLSGELVPHGAIALRDLATESVAEVLPALRNISVDGHWASERVREDIGQFITARQLSGCPVAIHYRKDGSR
jgi:hypothetical protein